MLVVEGRERQKEEKEWKDWRESEIERRGRSRACLSDAGAQLRVSQGHDFPGDPPADRCPFLAVLLATDPVVTANALPHDVVRCSQQHKNLKRHTTDPCYTDYYYYLATVKRVSYTEIEQSICSMGALISHPFSFAPPFWMDPLPTRRY